MSKKVSKKKNKAAFNQALKRYLIAIGLVFFSVIGLLEAGIMGRLISGVFRLVLGMYPQVFLALIIAVSMVYAMAPKYLAKMPKRLWIGSALAIVTFLIALSFPNANDLVGREYFIAMINKEYLSVVSDSLVPAYGGIIGMSLFALTSMLFDRMGTLVLCVALGFASGGLLLSPESIRKPIVAFVSAIKSGGRSAKSLGKKLVPVKDDVEEVRPVINDSTFVDMSVDTKKTKDSVFMDIDELSKPEPKKKDQMKLPIALDEPSDKHTLVVDDPVFDNYQLPPISLLEGSKKVSKSNENQISAKEKGKQIIKVLEQFGIEAELLAIHIGPSVTKFELKPDSNVKLNRISAIQDNIMMELAVTSLRIEAPIPGRAAVGIEIPNVEMMPVRLREIVVNTPHFFDKDNIWVALGKNLMGEPISIALNKMPHLLIAGATGSGKSVCINSIITSILLSKHPQELKLILIDPKKVEFTPFIGIPHLLKPVVTDAALASTTLKRVVEEMEHRYEQFAEAGVRNIAAYNQKVNEEKDSKLKLMPWIVVIIDELADLMNVAGREVEASIQRITQLARASGIHLIVATQRPSVDVVTGVIKANIPSRIAFAVSSAVDSRTILDTMGAEKLLGYGDMLYVPMGEPSPTRAQGVFVSDKEVNLVTKYSKDQAEPIYDETFNVAEIELNQEGVNASLSDPLIDQAIELVIKQKRASTSYLQRSFRIGYNRAASIMDELERRNIISLQDGSRARDVLYQSMDEYLDSLEEETE
jgi:DNA segregation ATPase FtsK/SpoIIIE, S-DNA-T family